MYTDILSILDSFRNASLGPLALSKIEEVNITKRASDIYATLSSLIIEGRGSTLIQLDGDIVAIDGTVMSNAINNGLDGLTVKVYSANGEYIRDKLVDLDEVINQLANEFEVADLENRVIRILSSMSDELSIASITSSINTVLSRTFTTAGAAFSEFINQLLIACPDAKAFKSSFFSLITPNPDEDIFTAPIIGTVTNTLGVALWAHDMANSIVNAIENIKVDFAGAINRACMHYIETNTLNASLTLLGLKRIGYWVTDIFQDPWASFTGDNADSLAFDNAFVDLGIASNELATAAIRYGLTNHEAFALPTIGATFYVYYKDNDVHIGLQKHIYDKDSAILLLRRISQTGNDWSELVSIMNDTRNPVLRPVKKGDGQDFTSVNQYNYYLAECILESEKLITLGLLALGNKSSIANAYYQDVDDIYRNRYRHCWIPGYNGSSSWDPSTVLPTTRPLFASHLTSVSSDGTFALHFADNQLLSYFDEFTSGSICAAHLPVSKVIHGYIEFNDDAILKEEVATTIEHIATGALVLTGIIAATTAVTKLKGAARTAAINAQRAILDSSVSITDAKAAIMKANRLSAIAGVSAPSLVSAFSSAPVLQPLPDNTEKIIRLIRGSD